MELLSIPKWKRLIVGISELWIFDKLNDTEPPSASENICMCNSRSEEAFGSGSLAE